MDYYTGMMVMSMLAFIAGAGIGMLVITWYDNRQSPIDQEVN